MGRTTILLLLGAVLTGAGEVDTGKIKKSAVTVEVKPEDAEKLKEIGTITKIVTTEVDKFPLPVVTILVNGQTPVETKGIPLYAASDDDGMISVSFIEGVNGALAKSYVWSVTDAKLSNKRFIPGVDGSIGFAAINDNKYRVNLAVTYLYPDNILRSQIFMADIVRGNAPAPDNTDNTNTLPAGKFGLAKKTYDNAISNVTVKKLEGAKAFSAALTTVVGNIDSGKYNTIGDNVVNDTDGATKKFTLQVGSILKDLGLANTANLQNAGVNKSDWAVFGSQFQKDIYGPYNSKEAKTVADIRAILDEANIGMKAYIKKQEAK